MHEILIEPHYLGCILYYETILNADLVHFEVCDTFSKQTYRNRCYFLLSNKVQPLIIPLKYRNGAKSRDVKIDYSQRWVKDHWGAFYSAYGKAPYFEFFQEDFKKIWEKKYEFLIDIQLSFLELSLRLLGKGVNYELTTHYRPSHQADYRNSIHPKHSSQELQRLNEKSYIQLFGTTFTPNLSIVDVLLNEGPDAVKIIL